MNDFHFLWPYLYHDSTSVLKNEIIDQSEIKGSRQVLWKKDFLHGGVGCLQMCALPIHT